MAALKVSGCHVDNWSAAPFIPVWSHSTLSRSRRNALVQGPEPVRETSTLARLRWILIKVNRWPCSERRSWAVR